MSCRISESASASTSTVSTAHGTDPAEGRGREPGLPVGRSAVGIPSSCPRFFMLSKTSISARLRYFSIT